MSTLTADLQFPRLEQNIPCLRCGYNLRTLAIDGNCPECSMPIASSIDAALLRYDDPTWTGMLSLAMGLMLFSASVELACVIVSLLLLQSADIWSIGVEPVHFFVNPLFWLAVFLLGHPHPHPPSPNRRFSLRRIMRLMALIALISAIVTDASSLDLSQFLPESLTELPCAHAIELLATILLFMYLLQLTRRTGHLSLLRHTRIAMAAMVLALCIWAFLDMNIDQDWSQAIDLPARLFLMPIFLYQLFVFFLFRRTLRQSTSFAQQHWHFCSPMPPAHPAS